MAHWTAATFSDPITPASYHRFLSLLYSLYTKKKRDKKNYKRYQNVGQMSLN